MPEEYAEAVEYVRQAPGSTDPPSAFSVWCAAVARLLLTLTLALLAITPFTEHFLTFDRFLRGGQDVELTLICLLALLCMVLLLAQLAAQSLALLLAATEWLHLALQQNVLTLTGPRLRRLGLAVPAPCPQCPSGPRNLFLRI